MNIQPILNEKDNKYGSSLDIDQDTIKPGIDEDVIKLISTKKREPNWLLNFRLKAYRCWFDQKENPPQWADIDIKPINFDQISYYAGIKKIKTKSLEETKKDWFAELEA